MKDIVAIEKRMTALIIPNGLSFSTTHAKYDYASFLKRDEAFSKISRVWRNSILEIPLPLTDLLAQMSGPKLGTDTPDTMSLKRFRERHSSTTISEFGFDSIMEDDSTHQTSSQGLDPALIVRREYNFGSSRSRFSQRHYVSTPDILGNVLESTMESNNEDIQEPAEISPETQDSTDDEQQEMQESILPCQCAFHYKATLIDQLVFVPFDKILEGLLFPAREAPTAVPRAFKNTLRYLGGTEVKFSPWKVYLGKWERRVWSCYLPASKVLLTDSYLHLKVTDSVIVRTLDKVCVESLMQIEGVPGGGCFVKWKLCITSAPTRADQTRVMITAAAASPLGSWFKESIRQALLQHTEELWERAVYAAADNSVEMEAKDSNGSFVSVNTTSNSLMRKPVSILSNSFSQKFPGSSINLTYFDRKAFARSIMQVVLFLTVLGVALILGRRLHNLDHQPRAISYPKTSQSKIAAILQEQYKEFLQEKLVLPFKYPQIIGAVAQDLSRIDRWLQGMVGSVHQIQQDFDVKHGIDKSDTK